MRRDIYQRIAASLRRVSLAVDRSILATDGAQKKRAMVWIFAWARAAKLGGSNAPK